jgi:hypothetical protein
VPPFSAKPCSAGSHPNTAAPLDRRSVEPGGIKVLRHPGKGLRIPGAIELTHMTADPQQTRMNCVYPTAASRRPLRVLRTRWAGIASWWGADAARRVMRGFSHQELELLRYVGTASREVAAPPPTAHRESFASSPGSPGSIATDEYAFSFDSPSGG